jgi:prophage maintenance system killer protein
MEEKIKIMHILHNKHNLEQKLSSMIYGSIEIREKDLNKYIYVHHRERGRLVSKYVGEYDDDLYNLILNNNLEVKKIKKSIRNLEKELKDLNYQECELSSNVKLNIDFAKRNLVDTIYKQAILEGVATTFADTESIIEGGKVNGMTSDDVMKVVNLKHAWEFILDENVILAEENFYLLSQINKLILGGFYYYVGNVRSTPAKIGGTSWVPSIPIESQIIEELANIFNKDLDDIDLSIELLLYVMKRQIFIDGNKRTAVIFANHHLISKGLGIIAIPVELTEEYKKLLISYYEGKDNNKIKEFLKKKCYIKI